MATTRRDIELLISAKETTGRSFSQVTSNIESLNRKIGEQIAQAERGEISLQELRRSQEALAQAGRDLSAIQGQIDTYNKLVATQDKVGAAADKAKADLAAFRLELEKADKVSAAQESKLQRLETAVVKTSAAYEKNTGDLITQTAALERAGIETKALDASQAGVVNNARQIGAGLVQVNAAIDGYAANVANARTQEQALAAQSGFERKISEAQQLGNASKFVQLFGDAIQTVAVADNQLAALTGFRAVGQMAVEAANDLTRFNAAGQATGASASQVAAGLRAIIDPAGEALRTLGGVEAAIEKADTQAAAGVKNVGLLSDAYNSLSAASAAILRQGSLVDGFRQQEAAVASARSEFTQAQAEVAKLGNAMASADKPTEALAAALGAAEAKLESTAKAVGVEEAKLAQLNTELKAADINTANLAAEQARLEAAATRVSGSMAGINKTLGRGGQRTNGLFGLKPNDLANLSYQLNDIFVSLASGQNPMIVFIQQGSQIGQIFPGIISTIARFALAWAPVLAIVALVGFAFKGLYDDAARLKKAQEDLAASPFGANLDPQKFADAQEKLESLGASAEDARAALVKLAEEGFDQEHLDKYSEAAQNLAERLGVDLSEATDMLVSIQKGGIEAVYDLTEKTNDLTAADLDHAEALFKAGKAGEARQFVLDRVAERNAQIARDTQSVWTPAVNNLKAAWSNFTGFLGSVFGPVIDAIVDKIKLAIAAFTFLTALLAGKGVAGAKADAGAAYFGAPKPGRGASDQNIRDRRYGAKLDEEELSNRKAITAEQRKQIVAQKARNDAQAAGVSKAVEDRAVQQAIALEQRKINEEGERAAKKAGAAGRRADAARRRAAAQAKAAENKREGAQGTLENQLRQLNRDEARGSSATLEQRLSAVDDKYEKIFDTLQKMRNLGLSADGEGTSLADVEKRVNAQKDILKSQETIKYYEEQIKDLTAQRKDEVENIADAQEAGALSVTKAFGDAEAVNNRISPKIVKAAQDALAVARNIAGTNPSPEMVSMIARLERIIAGEGTGDVAGKLLQSGFASQEAAYNQMLSDRNNLVSAYNDLKELGLRNDTETRAAQAKAYSDSAPAIQKQIDDMRTSLTLLHETKSELSGLPLITDAAYNAWIAKLEAVEAGLVNIDSRIAQVNAGAQQGFVQGFTSAVQTAADAIGGLIVGTKSWGEAFSDIGRGVVGILTSILDAVAQVLLQMIALKIAKSLLGGPTGGIGGLFFHDGGVVGGGGGSRKKRTGGMGSWAGAPKFHGGGGLGLQPGEYKAVLKQGEEVLTEDDPRHIRNIGNDNGGGGAPTMQQNVLLFDPEEIPRAMMGRSGVKSILQIVRANKATVKAILG